MRLSRLQSGNALVYGLVAVAAVAVIVWFFVLTPEPEPASALPSPDLISDSSAQNDFDYPSLRQQVPELPDPGAPSKPPASTETTPPQLSDAVFEPASNVSKDIKAAKPGDQARALIARIRGAAQRPDMHDIHVRGVQFLRQGQPVDAYLLWFFAGRDGHAPSALVLGEMYDPEYFSRANLLMESADPAQSYKWYLRAAQAGDPTADDRLSALHATVEQAAAEGNDDARRLLMRWK